MEIFRIKKLRIKGNTIFQNEIHFDFSQESDGFSFQAPYFTLIIGPNGTGKSNLLKYIIDVFRLAYDKKRGSEILYYPNGKYYLEYVFGDANYTILNTLGWEGGNEKPANVKDEKSEKGIRFFKNGSEISISEIKLPESILALSIMLTDKYLFIRNSEDFPGYKYLGVRRDNNTAGTRSFIGKTIEHIFAAASKKEFTNSLAEMLSFLELGNEFHISYSPRYKQHFFLEDLTREKFDDFFLNYKKYLPRRTTEPWSVAAFKQLKETEPDVIPRLVRLLKILTTKLKRVENSRAEYFEFNVFDIEPDFIEFFSLLPYLHQLNIISYPEITLKKENHYGIGDSSSGEYHFISTIVGLLATITNNSVVLIDEPEISLHPNWQMKYIAFLNKIFEKYNSSHFIICSHSHFLVSDLKAENSSVISLRRDDGITATTINANTYGWSAEQVLLDIFDVQTTRNYAVAEKLGILLDFIANEKNTETQVKNRFYELELDKLNNLQDTDPLKEVYNTILKEYVLEKPKQ